MLAIERQNALKQTHEHEWLPSASTATTLKPTRNTCHTWKSASGARGGIVTVLAASVNAVAESTIVDLGLLSGGNIDASWPVFVATSGRSKTANDSTNCSLEVPGEGREEPIDDDIDAPPDSLLGMSSSNC